jgi:hypothetical protein
VSGIKSATSQRLDSCPECGGPLEASVTVYLGGLAFAPTYDGSGARIIEWDDQSKSIGAEVRWYCQNDHDVTDTLFDLFGCEPLSVDIDGGAYSTQ